MNTDNATNDYYRAEKELDEFYEAYYDGELSSAHRSMRRFIILMVRGGCTPGDFLLTLEVISDLCTDVGIDFRDRLRRLQELFERFHARPT